MMKKPNIILIETHDTGRLFGCYGVQEVHTPCIDSLAAEGVKCTNIFGTSPICSPSRASLTTGRYPQSHGVVGGCHAPDYNRLSKEERHLSCILAENGYHCESFGLTHESRVGDPLGFHRKNYEIRPTLERYSCDILSPLVVEYLKTTASMEQPFYLQIGFFETHQPFDFGGVKADRTNGVYMPPHLLRTAESEEKMALLQGAIRKVDGAIGSILEAVNKNGFKENTLVMFTVDHGIEMPRAKFTLYDPGVHIPLILCWPEGGIHGGRDMSNLACNVDVLPTLLELLHLPAEPKIQGRSFASALRGASVKPHRDFVFACLFDGDARSVRGNGFKLIRNFSPRKIFSPPVDLKSPLIPGSAVPLVELYDLQRDPYEFYNVADDPKYTGMLNQLDMELWNWMRKIGDPLLNGPTPHRMWHENISACPFERHQEKQNGKKSCHG